MLLKIFHPPPPLHTFVESITYYTDYTAGYAVDRLLPDGTVNLIIDLTEAPKFIFDNETLHEKASYRKAWISGMHRDYISITAGDNSAMMVIRFFAGTAGLFFQLPLSELTDQVLDADLLLGQTEMNALRDALLEAPDAETKFDRAVAWLLQRQQAAQAIPAVVNYAVEQLLCNPAMLTIDALTRKTGYSNKHLNHLFQKHVGVSPKQLLRISRFQKVLWELENREKPLWTHLALDCGFYDQAHFINEFKRFSGLSPEIYLEEKGPFINYIPLDFDR